MIIATAIANRHRQSPIAIAVQSALPPRVESCAVVHMQVAIVGLYFMNIFQLVRKIGAGMQSTFGLHVNVYTAFLSG